jgi:hypothetical protein
MKSAASALILHPLVCDKCGRGPTEAKINRQNGKIVGVKGGATLRKISKDPEVYRCIGCIDKHGDKV